ncbi:hypothetical protein G6027_10285, partial [Dietzia sp. SLG310A2-38A2]|nr:hypothetical protein [Dietzia sp. SLG310A2-38A2]
MGTDDPGGWVTPGRQGPACSGKPASSLRRSSLPTATREALTARKAAGVQLGTPTSVPDAVLRRVITDAAEGRSLRQIGAGLMADGILTGS